MYPALGAYDRRLGGNRGPDIPGRDRSPYGDSGFRRPGDEDRGFLDRASDEVASWFGDEEAARRREVDHRGKGPRGYRRADARIAEDLHDRLCDDPALDATDIEVSVADGEVVLAGHVDSKVARRRAEDCAEAVSGVAYVQNNLRVRPLGQVPPATTPAP
ncbi:MAG: BON domain-containing protein [Gemmobacter sp.]|nr:BON domain-containing protein [Gemmobacter sp.]